MRVLAVFFAMIISFNVWYSFSYFIYFKINQEEIIQNYCENIDYPELECNGQCHLAKELAIVKVQNQEEAQGKIIGIKSIFTPVFKSSVLAFNLRAVSLEIQKLNVEIPVQKLRSYSKKVKHPPQSLLV